MASKFGRRFRVTIDPKDGLPNIVVEMPMTIQFWLKRDTLASLNNISIDIYNLSEESRRRTYQDRFNLDSVTVNGVPQGRRTIKLEIGYETLYEVYSGTIFSASTARQGTNLITRIEGLTGVYDIASSLTFQTIAAGEPLSSLFKTLVGQFPTLKIGAIGNWPQIINRPATLNGKTWDLIKQYAQPGQTFIDNDKVYILQPNEVLQTPVIPLIDSSTGLLGTPRREQALLIVDTLLDAGIQVNQLVELFTTVEPAYNGQYSVAGIEHKGVISGSVSGECRSTFTLLAPNYFSYSQVAQQ